MAYKIAKGDSKLLGSIVAPGNIQAKNLGGTDQDITASAIVATDDIIVTGKIKSTTANIRATNSATLYSGINDVSDPHIKLESDSNSGKVTLYGQASSDQDLVISNDSGGKIQIGNAGSFGTTLKASDNSWTGRQFDIGGNFVIGGNLTLTEAKLRVVGSDTTIDGGSTEFQTDAEVITLASSSAGVHATDGAGIRFGFDGNAQNVNDAGLELLFEDTGGLFKIFNSRNNGAALYDMQANKYYGDASGLTGVAAVTNADSKFESVTHSDATITNTECVVGKLHILTHTGANVSVTLPTTTSLVPGQTLKIKAGQPDSADGIGGTGNRKATITVQDTSDEVIGLSNSRTSITLDSSHAAIELLYLGSVTVGGTAKLRWAIM